MRDGVPALSMSLQREFAVLIERNWTLQLAFKETMCEAFDAAIKQVREEMRGKTVVRVRDCEGVGE